MYNTCAFFHSFIIIKLSFQRWCAASKDVSLPSDCPGRIQGNSWSLWHNNRWPYVSFRHQTKPHIVSRWTRPPWVSRTISAKFFMVFILVLSGRAIGCSGRQRGSWSAPLVRKHSYATLSAGQGYSRQQRSVRN
jgi:hypothetical protein